MKIHQVLYITCAILFELVGLVVFMRGFLPLKAAIPGFASLSNTSYEPILPVHLTKGRDSLPLHPLYGRLILVLIDALRADFVLPNVKSNLPRLKFVEELLNQSKTQSFLAKAQPPTVTMPRIKALTTGGIPGFVDVVLNFDSTALQEDNLIGQLYEANKKIVFYGDDTWMKLFPEHFTRSDGTTSFFVTDYTEVDTNVTRHLDEELTMDDWDVLILHYLGLDHIGHLAGPYSPLVPGKLDEMDGVIKKLYDSLVLQQGKPGQLPSLMIVCGDHGMSDQGSHGGATPSETTTPLVFMSSLTAQGGAAYEGVMVEQIDLAPSLALLLGTPIPQNSLGIVIPDVLSGHSTREKLKALHANAEQILNVFKKNVPNFDEDLDYLSLQRAIQMHMAWLEVHLSANSSVDETRLGNKVIAQYRQALQGMRDKVAASLTKYDIHAMVVGITVLWMVLLSLLYGWCVPKSALVVTLGWKGSFILVLVLRELFSVHAMWCTDVPKSPFLCGKDSIGNVIVGMLLIWISMWVTVAALIFISIVKAIWQYDYHKMVLNHSLGSILLVTGTVLHTMTLLASSFVEEEHQTWYFFTVTLHVVLWLSFTFKALSCKSGRASDAFGRDDANTMSYNQYLQLQDMEALNSLHKRVYQRSNSYETIMKTTSPDQDGMEKKDVKAKDQKPKSSEKRKTQISPKESHCTLNVVKAFITGSDRLEQLGQDVFWFCAINSACVLVLCRILRTWNQTGDKWSHLPDVGDWLVRPENKNALSIGTMLSLVVGCLMMVQGKGMLSKMLFAGTLGAIYCFRAANGDVVLSLLYSGGSSKGVFEAQSAYCLLLCFFLSCGGKFIQRIMNINFDHKNNSLQEAGSFLKGLQATWTLIYLLLMRPHNICMAVMVIAQERCLSHVVHHYRFTIPSLTLLYMWMGQAAFYYQGNSNSISTVDVSAGYIGLDNYNALVIGVLMCLSTYAGPIFWSLSLVVQIAENTEKHAKVHQFRDDILQVVYTLLLSRAFPVAVYAGLVTLQRYHLFVWSVFSPKLLYEAMFTLVNSIACCLLLGMRYF